MVVGLRVWVGDVDARGVLASRAPAFALVVARRVFPCVFLCACCVLHFLFFFFSLFVFSPIR